MVLQYGTSGTWRYRGVYNPIRQKGSESCRTLSIKSYRLQDIGDRPDTAHHIPNHVQRWLHATCSGRVRDAAGDVKNYTQGHKSRACCTVRTDAPEKQQKKRRHAEIIPMIVPLFRRLFRLRLRM